MADSASLSRSVSQEFEIERLSMPDGSRSNPNTLLVPERESQGTDGIRSNPNTLLVPEHESQGLRNPPRMNYMAHKWVALKKAVAAFKTNHPGWVTAIKVLFVVLALIGIGALTIHLAWGFSHFASWMKAYLTTHITVGQVFAFYVAPLVGGALVIAAAVLVVKAINKRQQQQKVLKALAQDLLGGALPDPTMLSTG